jgi:hypothetical protein
VKKSSKRDLTYRKEKDTEEETSKNPNIYWFLHPKDNQRNVAILILVRYAHYQI